MSIYTSGVYLERNPTWHEEDAAWKAKQIISLIRSANLEPGAIRDIGCGTGEVARLIAEEFTSAKVVGYDVSDAALSLARTKEGSRLRFESGTGFGNGRCDLALAIDVFEHLDDCIGFLRQMSRLADRSIYHIPLDLSAQAILRGAPLNYVRQAVGHLHYFTKDTAIATLKHAGLSIERWLYTAGHTAKRNSPRTWLASFPRRFAYRIAPDFAVRALGGYSLLVLCKGSDIDNSNVVAKS